MADMIKCPLCAAMNPPENKICLRCQTPLSGESFQTGQAPVRKDTGELEPILPEWLRDARETAKQSGMGERFQREENAQPAAPSADLLAGLQSQAGSDDEEDIPDWLANITGKPAPKPKADEPKEDFSNVRWVETGRKDDFEQEQAEGDLPAWMTGTPPSVGDAGEKDELTDWFRESGAGSDSIQSPFQSMPDSGSAFSAAPSSEETPDWLKQMDAEAKKGSQPAAEESSMDWLNQPSEPATDAQSAGPFGMPASDDLDWLTQLKADSTPQADASPAPDSPNWLKDLGAPPSVESTPFVESAPAESEPFDSADFPSWLADETSKKSDSDSIWLEEKGEAGASAPADDAFGDLPDWLKSAAPQSSIFDEPAAAVEVQKPEEPQAPVNPPFETTPAFVDDSLSDESLFTDMPDWLSNATDAPVASSASAEPAADSDALAPNILPSWVEAMRPVDQAVPGAASLAGGQTLEQSGALAGLQGVLPAGMGFAPTSKPKAYSNKLNVNEEQLKHAEIFEQILAAETAPEMLIVEKTLGASRGLRWTIAALLVIATLATLLSRAQFLSAPVGVPKELGYAVAAVQAIPENAPALVAVDYEPARAGEMEAAAAPLFDNLMLLKHPRMTFVATNESGAILVERFIAGTLAERNYQSGVTYLNLGYLAGGQVGIRAFAQNPQFAAPLDISGFDAWGLPPLEGVTALNQFALILLVTDDAEAARAWVEQTQDARGVVPIVVVSSAQAAPMIQPYYESRQIAGMVSGLYGGAIVERQYNNGRPGLARRYWDAYSIGMFLAAVFTLGGGFVNFALGLRDRAAAGGEE